MGQVREFSTPAAPMLDAPRVARALSAWGRTGRRAAAQGLGHAAEPAEPTAGASVFRVTELALDFSDERRAEWAGLAARALEPNAFFEPGFALAAARHFPPDERPRFICLRNPQGALAAIFPLAPQGLFGPDGLLRLWRGELAALATPLVERDQAQDALAAFLDWAAATSPAAAALFPRMPAGGAFHAALAEAAARRGRRLEIVESFARAALLPGGSAAEKCARAGGRKKVNEIGRLQRRLAEQGAVEVSIDGAPGAVRAAVEEFLALEAAGWKAGRGAFLSEPALATFLRSATRLLAADGLCRVAALRLDGRAVAMAILLESQNRSYCWKIAFDERLRAQAPGVQLIHALTALQLARPEIELTDSCAIAKHPMIDRLWPERVEICDVAVSLRESGFDAALRREKARRRIRALAKDAARRLLKRKAS